MASTVMELIKEIDSTRSQRSSSAKDEVRVMTEMLNDSEFVVGVYNKTGLVSEYCPHDDAHAMVANIIKGATKMPHKEAEQLSAEYEFTKSDAQTFINIGKEFINTYVKTGRKLPLGGREDSNISLSRKIKEARSNNFPKKVGVNDDGSDKYEICGDGTIPAHASLRVHSSCPPWLK